MALIYRYARTIPNGEHPPILPGITFSEIFNISQLYTISLDIAEELWNKHRSLVFIQENNTNCMYYVLVADYIYDSLNYQQIITDDPYETNVSIYNTYIIPSLYYLFIQRFNERLRTRKYLNNIIRSIPYPSTELAYHCEVCKKICTNHLMNGFEHSLLRKYVNESLEIIRDEEEYRPDGRKMLELKRDFEELALLMMPI